METEAKLSRTDLVLSALAGAEDALFFTPAQVQKLLFLIDENIPKHIGGKRFNFAPYDYGPFDATVYRDLEFLASKGLVSIGRSPDGRLSKTYCLTSSGSSLGRHLLGHSFSSEIAEYIRKLASWVSAQSFEDLVATIYQRYPHMKANSVFRH